MYSSANLKGEKNGKEMMSVIVHLRSLPSLNVNFFFLSDLKENVHHKIPGASNAETSIRSLRGISDMGKAPLLTPVITVSCYRELFN